MSTVRSLAQATRSAITSFRQTWNSRRALSARATNRRVGDCALDLKGRYFITTDRGVYRLEKAGLFKVFDLPAYGIATDGAALYLALYLGNRSLLVRAKLAPFIEGGGEADLVELHAEALTSSNQRIHALWLGREHLWVANTGRNALLRIDRNDPARKREIPLFLDRFGYPLQGDVNHINGVSEYDGTVFFSAYRAGEQAMIGLYDGRRVSGHAYPNVGIHDIYLSDRDLFFCDTFGPPGGGGALMTGSGPFDPGFFSQGSGYIVRGLAGTPDELLIGHSHKGERAKRFDGKGSILLAKDGRVVGEQEIEAAQVYQIMSCDGGFVRPAPQGLTAEEARRRLTACLGAPIYDVELEAEAGAGAAAAAAS